MLNTDVSVSFVNNSMVSKKLSLFNKKPNVRSILSKDDSRLSDKSGLKGLSSLTIKREVVKAAKKLVPAEFVTIQTLLEISNDLEKAKVISQQLRSSDRSDFEEFFKKRQIKTKRGLFRKKKFVIIIEVDGFLVKRVDSRYELNYYGLEIIKKYLTRFCFVAYSRQNRSFIDSFKSLLGKDQIIFDCYLESSFCYIYEDKQLKSPSIIKEEALLIDTDLTSLYINPENTIYLPKSSGSQNFEKFNSFMEKLYENLLSKNFKLKEILNDLGIHYNLLTYN